MQCVAGTAPCSLWQNAFLTDMARYPWSETRGSAHFIEAARATQAWTMSNMTYNGMSAKTMLQDTINNLWANGVDLSNGGMYQNWGTPNDGRTPEPNMQVLTAFNPNLPSWFDQPNGTISVSNATSTSSHTAPSTTTSSRSTSTLITNNVETSIASSTSIALTTSSIQTTLPTAASPSVLVAATVNPQQPKSSAIVLGGFAAFETFVIGLIPISLLTKMSRPGRQKSTKDWRT